MAERNAPGSVFGVKEAEAQARASAPVFRFQWSSSDPFTAPAFIDVTWPNGDRARYRRG